MLFFFFLQSADIIIVSSQDLYLLLPSIFLLIPLEVFYLVFSVFFLLGSAALLHNRVDFEFFFLGFLEQEESLLLEP